MMQVSAVSLQGRHASLVPLSMSHLDALVEAVRDGELWALWYTFIPRPEGMQIGRAHV